MTLEVLIDTDSYAGCACGTGIVNKRYKTVNRSVTTDYHEKIARQVYIAPLPYTANDLTWSFPNCSAKPISNYNWWTWGWNSCMGGFNHSVPGNSNNDLKSKLLSKMDAHDLNLAMASFEGVETMGMLKRRALQLYKAARSVRKGKFKRASRTLGYTLPQRAMKRLKRRDRLQQFNQNWMEFRYGWTPLLMDIHGAADILGKEVNEQNMMYSPRTSVTESFDDIVTGVGYPNFVYGGINKATVRRGMGLDYYVTDPDLRFDEALGLTNPALMAWEFVPFSFVADWFLPIGDALKSITAFQGLSFMGGYVYRKEDINFFATSCDGSAHGWVFASGMAPVFYQAKNFSRSAQSNFWGYHINPWELSNGLNAYRAMDAIALLHGFLKVNAKGGLVS